MIQVPYGNSPELVLNPVKVNDAGFYICRVNSESSFAFSQWARLEVCDLQGASHSEWQKLFIAGHLHVDCTLKLKSFFFLRSSEHLLDKRGLLKVCLPVC